MESVHKTVLLNETIDGLNLHDGAIVVDATFGGGGHSREICRRCKGVKIIAIDQDNSAWEKAKSKFEDCVCDIKFVNKNMENRILIKNLKQHIGEEIIIAGAVDLRRDHGKLIFIDLLHLYIILFIAPQPYA